MELHLQNQLQCRIADLLWQAETPEAVHKIIEAIGPEARVVYELMTAAAFDEVEDTTDACRVIQAVVDKL